ncbi:MAG: hypothetical protein GX215_05185 [Clostridiales Family XIII bacterium]|nr:hypothetical protein [Clostridiales Family XIII bacterium]
MSTVEKDNLAIEYIAQLDSPMIEGEVKANVGENGLVLKVMFEATEIPYAAIRSFELRDYVLTVETDFGAFRFSKMGNWCQPFYDELSSSYNGKVRKALFVDGSPVIKVRGKYHLDEHGYVAQGDAEIQVYEDCVLILPPNDGARRIPLCFVTSVEKGDFTQSLQLDTEERYTFEKLGYDTEPFADAIAEQLHLLREKTLRAIKAIDPSLTPQQAFVIAKKMPKGVAAPVGSLAAVAPSFASALEKRIHSSRSRKEYEIFKTICDPARIWVGFHAFDEKKDTENGTEEEFQSEGMLWLIVPGQRGDTGAVEFIVTEEESAATFIYQFRGDFDGFARSFNRALEAISFRREVIRLSDDALQKPEYATYAMAVRHNPALQFVRGSFAGRVIHSSIKSWQKGVLTYLKA